MKSMFATELAFSGDGADKPAHIGHKCNCIFVVLEGFSECDVYSPCWHIRTKKKHWQNRKDYTEESSVDTSLLYLIRYHRSQARSQVFLRGGAIQGGGSRNQTRPEEPVSGGGELGCLRLNYERFKNMDISRILEL